MATVHLTSSVTNYTRHSSSGKSKGETEVVVLTCKAPDDKSYSPSKTGSLVCCAEADFRLIYSPLHAALLLPPEFFLHWQDWCLLSCRDMSAQPGAV